MMLPPVFDILRDDSNIAGLIGTRIYRHGAAPPNVIAPYVTWFVVVGTPENSLTNLPSIDRYSIQVDCWSNNTGSGSVEIETVAEAVRDALEPFGHMTALAVNERDFDTQRYRIGMTFDIWVQRSTLVPYL